MNDFNLSKVSGDGSPKALSTDTVGFLREEVMAIVSDARAFLGTRRKLARDTFSCQWEGQFEDGRKHDVGNERAKPFEGASDMRIRLANQLVSEQARILKTAVKRMNFEGVSANGQPLALQAAALFGHVKANLLGPGWMNCWRKVFTWLLADAPAAAVVGVFWDEQVRLKYQRMSIEDLVGVALQNAEETFEMEVEASEGGGGSGSGAIGDGATAVPVDVGSEERAAELQAAALESILQLVGGGDETREQLAGWLANVLPEGVSKKTLRKAARDLQRGGDALVPVPEVAFSGPVCAPLRLFEDVFFPANTRDTQEARCIILREWVGEAELHNRVLTRGYAAKWVEEVLKGGEGISYLPMQEGGNLPEAWAGGWTGFAQWAGVRGHTAGPASSLNRGLWEVLTCYRKAVTEDGVPGVFVSTFSGAAEVLAKDEELLEYAHGKYPFVLFVHEQLSHLVWDSRGIPELAASDQYALKLLNDTFNDHTQLSTIPPVIVPANRPDFSVSLGPMDQIRLGRNERVEFLHGPPYPQSNDVHRRDIAKRVNEFFGRQAEGISPELAQGVADELVDDHMPAVGEVIAQMLQLCGQFMPPQIVAEVLGIEVEEAAGVLARLSSRLVVQVSFDARMLSQEWLKSVGDLIGQYLLSWDSEATVDRAAVVRYFAERISPELARVALRPVETAAQGELDDEDTNLAKIAAGIEPPMLETGQNFGARLQRIQQNLQANPELVALFQQRPVNAQILEARMKHLQGMVQQQENAQIGRLMAKPALAADQAAAGA
jgi:hypothetical protein